MADQAITALPKKTYSGSSQIASTDYLLGIDSAEGYQMLIQDLGEYIINRATASLAGSTQTLASAISALNSKWITITGQTSLWSDATLNAIKTAYNSMTDRSTVNAVVSAGGIGYAIIFRGTASYGTVVLTTYGASGADNPDSRSMQLINGTWGGWIKLPTRAEVDTLNSNEILSNSLTKTRIPVNSNFNSYTTPGVYYVSSDSDGATMINVPRKTSGKLIVMSRHSTGYLAQYYYPSTGTFTRYIRSYYNDGWGAWIEERIDYYNNTNKAFDLGSISSASTKTFEEYGLSKYQYGAYFVVIRGDVAPDATFVGIVRHNSSGYQISEIYKGNGAAAPSIDANGVIKTGTSSGATFQALVFPIIVWGNQL